MNKLTRAIVLLAACMLGSMAVKAQHKDVKVALTLQPNIGLPMGKVKQTNGTKYGGDIGLDVQFDKQWACVLQLGGGYMAGKSYTSLAWGGTGTYSNIVLVQVRAGVKYYLIEDAGLFVMGLVGRTSAVYTGDIVSTFTGLSFAPGVGIGTRFADVNLRYDNALQPDYILSQLVLSLNFKIGLN